MTGHASKVALAAGALVLLALGFALYQLTRVDAPAAATPHAPAPAVATPEAPTAPVASSPPASRAHEPIAVVVPAHPRPIEAKPDDPAPTLAPTPKPGPKRDANGKFVPIVPVASLKWQFGQTDAPMQACLDKSGKRPTGKATLAFTVAAKDGKVVIDSTNIEDEETLAPYPELLACMHATARALVVDGYPVPELGTSIYVRRTVRLDAGAIVENKIYNFSYL